jgi:hypothetical protein
MNEVIKADMSEGTSSETTTTRKENEDGSYIETRVEKVEGGFIKTVNERFKKGDEWEYKESRSVSTEHPSFAEKTTAEKLEEIMKNI